MLTFNEIETLNGDSAMEAKDQGSLFESEIPENASEILNLQEAAFWFNVSKANTGKRDNASSQNSKGQLISECLFDFLNFPKKHRKI